MGNSKKPAKPAPAQKPADQTSRPAKKKPGKGKKNK